MTREDIIKMAIEEAEFVFHGNLFDDESEVFVCTDKDIVRLFHLVAAVEREACAKLCETKHFSSPVREYGAKDCAAAIRARGQG